MLKFNANETKKLKFGIALTGVQSRDLKGTLRLEVNGIEYGFPVSIVNDKVEVEIPPLSGLITEIKSDAKYNVKLELIANDTYIIPWLDVAQIKIPVNVKISENIEEENKKVTIGITKIDEEKPVVKEKSKPRKRTKFTNFLNE